MMNKLNSSWIILFIIGCSGSNILPHAAGGRDMAVIIAPSGSLYGQMLKPYLAKPLYFPSKEEVYRVIISTPEALKNYRYWRNVILIGWDGTYIDTLISPGAKKIVDAGKGLFSEQDLWVREQTVVLLAGKNKKSVKGLILKYGDTIYQILRSAEKKRMKKIIYMNGFEKRESGKMLHLLGASYNIPLGYAHSVQDVRIMAYIRHFPDRIVTLYFEEGSKLKDPISLRDRLFKKYFEGDFVLKDYTKIDTVRFQGRKALRVIGIWQNEEKVMGGPFISYMFVKDGILYFLDGHVFSPDKKKWPYLDEVDIILHTFRTEL
ncbi:MAG TPA: DUF4837 family protein [candidate division WOR-3 bacterium]|uniref:DUF4837 family protein n=1 Tax=candidate division WOR-3 bacterium TaxID=2052148 RepID=A0A7C5DDP5_UNCW3|nr:DUF4837 family protein [candidate division WOR-3 bacterium]